MPSVELVEKAAERFAIRSALGRDVSCRNHEASDERGKRDVVLLYTLLLHAVERNRSRDYADIFVVAGTIGGHNCPVLSRRAAHYVVAIHSSSAGIFRPTITVLREHLTRNSHGRRGGFTCST